MVNSGRGGTREEGGGEGRGEAYMINPLVLCDNNLIQSNLVGGYDIASLSICTLANLIFISNCQKKKLLMAFALSFRFSKKQCL